MSRPVPERSEFVEQACADDAPLLAEVRRRVDWEARLNGFLLAPVVPRERIDQPFSPGDELLNGRFRVLRLAGEGGMGVVYEALDEKLGHRIAIKCPRFEFRRRLSPEAVKALQVTHPNVCRVFEIHTEATLTGEVDFLTMEFIDGETLAARIEQGVPKRWLQSSEGKELVRQVCAGLKAVHAQGIVHRDLKASNVMLTRDAAGGSRAVIMDFGIAHGADLFTSAARGTPAYLAPELWRGQRSTVRSDIYALGVLLHEMGSGRKPFADDADWRTRLESRPLAQDVSEPLRSAIRRCLEPVPERRFASVAELENSLFRRRWFLRALVGTAACTAAGAFVRQQYWPSSPVRLVVLPPVMGEGATPEEAAFTGGFLHDLSYRLKTLRGVRRPLSVFSVAQAGAEAVKTPRQARAVLAGTHVVSVDFVHGQGGFALNARLADTASGAALREWTSRAANIASAATDLLGLQSQIVQGTLEALLLRGEPSRHTLSREAYNDYLQGLHQVRKDYENSAKAIPFFERVVAAAPDSALGYAGLAEALLQTQYVTGDRSLEPKAVMALDKAEQLDPDLAHVHMMACRLNSHTGRYERALADCRRTVELEPTAVEAYIEMGYVLALVGRYSDAEAAFYAGIRAQPDFYKPYIDAGLLHYERHDYDSAERRWLEAVRLNPVHTRARINLAYIYLYTGRLNDADREARECLRLRRSRVALELWGSVLRIQRRDQEAVAIFEEAARTPPSNPWIWADLSAAYRKVGRAVDAAAADRRGLAEALRRLAINFRDPDTCSWCAFYHACNGEKAAAHTRAAEALALANPPLARVLKRLIFTYDALQEFDAALKLIESAPPAFAKELWFGVDVSDTLRRDPRFARLIR